ncbi:TPR domain protein [Delphinella strobiligena]|nr:TPR domain protein [Delphinella strobiligena]
MLLRYMTQITSRARTDHKTLPPACTTISCAVVNLLYTRLNNGYYDLGHFHRPVSTNNQLAQIWFDRGLIWSYAFNHEEAVTCFENAIAEDPSCAMAYWGLAYSLGPNYNKPWDFFDEQDLDTTVNRTHRAVEQAKEHMTTSLPLEQALINALHVRYPQEHAIEDCSIWNTEYADAMGSVYREFPDDLDVAALYADALMNLNPWQLWDLPSGKPAIGTRTQEVKAVLDRALAQEAGLTHPGLLHLYIHLMEMSGTPECALTVADHLRGLVPDAGHLQHMPSHLDILCGDYRRAIASNSDAIRADRKFLAKSGPLNFYTLYRAHNYHFRVYAALFSGQSKVALDTCEMLEASIPEELLRVESPPMADWLEGFLSMRMHALVRFGRWQDILDLDLPQNQELYCVTTAMTHYAKGIAFASLGRVDDAEKQQDQFFSAVERVVPTRTLFNNTCVDILAVASAMLDGELAYRRGNIDAAFDRFQHSIALYDGLPYDEPWGWMQPVRHAYGALLLEQGRTDKAAAVYSADLGFNDTLPRALQHPNNVWALHGYHECLTKMGRDNEARMLGQQLRLALAVADVPIESSCFCRLMDENALGQWLRLEILYSA